MATITLKANKDLNGNFVETRYWRNGASVDCKNFLYVNNYDYNNWKSRILFYFPSTLTNQVVVSATLKIKSNNSFSSEAKTAPICIKSGLNGGNNDTSYNNATEAGSPIENYMDGTWFNIQLNSDCISQINSAIKNNLPINFYLGPDSNNNTNYGARFYGYNYETSANRPVLELNYQAGLSTGKIETSNPKIGSPIHVSISPKVSTYTHKVEWIIGGNSIVSTNVGSLTKFTWIPLVEDTLNFFNNSTTGTRISSICRIHTYSNTNQKLGSYDINFTLNMADYSSGLVCEWLTEPSAISTKSPLGKGEFISGHSSIKINKGSAQLNDGATIKEYRVKINDCGINIDEAIVSDSYTTNILTTSNTKNFTVIIYIVDSRGRTSEASWDFTATCYSYEKPKVSNIQIFRSNETDGSSATEFGSNVIIKGNYSYSSISGNSLESLSILNFTKISVANGSFSFYSSKIGKEESFSTSLIIEDQISSDIIPISIPSARYLIHIPRGGKGLGLGTAGIKGYIKLGLPVYGLEISSDSNFKLFGSSVNSIDSFQKAIGGPFLTKNDEITTNLILSAGTNSIYGETAEGIEKILQVADSNTSGQVILGDDLFSTVIKGDSLTYNNYTILHSGNYTSIITSLGRIPSSYQAVVSLNESYFKPYSGDDDSTAGNYPNGLELRRYGEIVEFEGAITPIKELTGNTTETVICTLPSGYRPRNLITQVCQGSTQYVWLLRIRPNGEVTFSRYRRQSGWENCPTGAWLTFHVCFIR